MGLGGVGRSLGFGRRSKGREQTVGLAKGGVMVEINALFGSRVDSFKPNLKTKSGRAEARIRGMKRR